jgi:4-hydroxy-3-polyprenylbenzoate decarboxylase
MIVSIRKSYAGHARKVMNGIWAMGQAMFTKCIIVVDEDCDVQDLAEVTLRVANNIDPERDIQFTLGPVDSLDHASRLPNYGSKMGIDATRKWAAEGFLQGAKAAAANSSAALSGIAGHLQQRER